MNNAMIVTYWLTFFCAQRSYFRKLLVALLRQLFMTRYFGDPVFLPETYSRTACFRARPN